MVKNECRDMYHKIFQFVILSKNYTIPEEVLQLWKLIHEFSKTMEGTMANDSITPPLGKFFIG